MPKPKQDDPKQSRRFIEIAEANSAENDTLKEAVKKIAAYPRVQPPNKKPSEE